MVLRKMNTFLLRNITNLGNINIPIMCSLFLRLSYLFIYSLIFNKNFQKLIIGIYQDSKTNNKKCLDYFTYP